MLPAEATRRRVYTGAGRGHECRAVRSPGLHKETTMVRPTVATHAVIVVTACRPATGDGTEEQEAAVADTVGKPAVPQRAGVT